MGKLNCPVAVGYDVIDGRDYVTIHQGQTDIVGITPDMARHVAMQLLMTADKVDPQEPENVYIHDKSGVRYQKLHEARMEADGSDVIVYRCLEGSNRVWVRPEDEFRMKFSKEVSE